jgi:hypothetical protein|tara:strand:+ start:108 stop:290 length:183 start_codon:yes stop_codon:yes gene_type:complete
MESEALMNGELIARILMVLTGFVLAMLGVIVFIHGQHYEIGILISFAGICSMFGGLPYYE